MSIFNKSRATIAQYWASRYLIALSIGILVIGIVMVFWIKHTTVEHRLNLAQFIAEDTASRIVANFQGGDNDFKRETENRNYDATDLQPHTYVINAYGDVVASNITKENMLFTSIQPSILNTEETYLTVQYAKTKENYYLISKKIQVSNQVIGWVLVLDTEQNFTQVDNQYSQLIIALIVAGLIGWLSIYLLSKRLAKPLVAVTNAAKEIEKGNYQVQLASDAKEQEVYDLVHSFKEMSLRLQKLEQTRTELLAGVTHELKTPVASISGLLQAIDEKIVTDEEAEEFIRLSLKETTKLKTMVEDLLAFNSFASNTLPLSNEVHSVDELVQNVIVEWKIGKEHEDVSIDLLTKDCFELVEVDYVRFNQILVNLFNNALQSMENRARIVITLEKEKEFVSINVKDFGKGIPESEQHLIFERFYRGENKKYGTRGLGLGLSLSRMLANAMKGELILKETSSSGTTFSLMLPIYKE